MAVVPPTDAELDALIRARLALIGIDLTQLPEAATDPATGAPSQVAALSYLRGVLRGTATTLNAYDVSPDGPALDQQVAPPALYPSILTAWTA